MASKRNQPSAVTLAECSDGASGTDTVPRLKNAGVLVTDLFTASDRPLRRPSQFTSPVVGFTVMPAGPPTNVYRTG